MSSVAVYADGTLGYSPSAGRERCGSLAVAELELLSALIVDDGTRGSIQKAAEKGAGYADSEEIEIGVGEFFAEVPLELAPPKLSRLLDVVARAMIDHLGVRAPWIDRASPPPA